MDRPTVRDEARELVRNVKDLTVCGSTEPNQRPPGHTGRALIQMRTLPAVILIRVVSGTPHPSQ